MLYTYADGAVAQSTCVARGTTMPSECTSQETCGSGVAGLKVHAASDD